MGAVAVAALGAGAAGQRCVDAAVRRLPAPGRFVNVDGRAVHLADSDPQGAAPVVVAETGLGGTGADWDRVADHLGADVRVLGVDRPGLGRSELGGAPDVAGTVRRLEAVVEALGLRRPVVLAGWSLGGLLDVGVALTRPDLVAGLVLVEPSHPDEARRFGDPALTWWGRLLLRGLGAGAMVGGAALAGIPSRLAYLRANTRDGGESLWQVPSYATSASGRALAAELLGFPSVCDEVGRLRPDVVTVADRPTVLLSATRRSAGGASAWREMHADLATWFGAVEVRSVDRSGHDMVRDRPDAVARAIREVVEASAVLSPP